MFYQGSDKTVIHPYAKRVSRYRRYWDGVSYIMTYYGSWARWDLLPKSELPAGAQHAKGYRYVAGPNHGKLPVWERSPRSRPGARKISLRATRHTYGDNLYWLGRCKHIKPWQREYHVSIVNHKRAKTYAHRSARRAFKQALADKWADDTFDQRNNRGLTEWDFE